MDSTGDTSKDESYGQLKQMRRAPSCDQAALSKYVQDINTSGEGGNWSKKNMYRTSYFDMSISNGKALKQPVHEMGYQIPRYAGLVPGKDGFNELGRSYTKISKRCMDRQMNKSCDKFRSGGFVPDQLCFDPQRASFTRRFGQETILSGMIESHPAAQQEGGMNTTFRKSYLIPTQRTRPNIRRQINEEENCQFEDTGMLQSKKKRTYSSGYHANAQLFDDTTWVPEQNCHTDNQRSEYRMRFNQAKPFHRPAMKNSSGRMPKNWAVYDVQDANPLKNWKEAHANSIIGLPAINGAK